MKHYSIEPRTRKYAREYGLCHSQEIYPRNMGINFWILLQKQDYMLQKLLLKKLCIKQLKQHRIARKQNRRKKL